MLEVIRTAPTPPVDTNELVSAVTTAVAPDGKPFDILTAAGPEAINIRGAALVAMRQLVSQLEPTSLWILDTRKGLSADYVMSDAIRSVNNLDLKAGLVRIQVLAQLAENHRSAAIETLAYADAAQLELPEFSEQFVHDQFHTSMGEGRYYDAYRIAGTMVREGRKLIRTTNPATSEKNMGIKAWEGREDEAFLAYAQQCLEEWENRTDNSNDWRLRHLFNAFRFREDGYKNRHPSQLATKIAHCMVQYEIDQERHSVALQFAQIARFPQAEIKALSLQVAETEKGGAIHQITSRLRRKFE